MTHCETLNEKKRIFQWILCRYLDCPHDICTSVSEDASSSEYGSDSDNVNIRTTKRQKTLVIDSDTKSENETHVKDFLQVCQV